MLRPPKIRRENKHQNKGYAVHQSEFAVVDARFGSYIRRLSNAGQSESATRMFDQKGGIDTPCSESAIADFGSSQSRPGLDRRPGIVLGQPW